MLTMKEKDLKDSFEPGDYAFDESKHKYGDRIGFRWEAKDSKGRYRAGIEKTREAAEEKAKTHSR